MLIPVLLLGLIILVSFVGHILFKYTKVPESLFMIIIGLAAGPVLKIVDQAAFMTYIPLVSAITMIIILLESGFSLTIDRTVRTFKSAICLTSLNLLFNMFFIGFFMYFMGWDLSYALFLGLACSETTTIVVLTLIPGLSSPEVVKETLILDSILSDVMIVTLAVIFMKIIKIQTFNLTQIITSLFNPTIVAVALGALFILIWINILWKFYRDEELVYIFTLGMLFILHVLVEFFGGISALAIIIFSLILGNLPVIITSIQDEFILRKKILSEYQIETFQFLSQRFTNITREIKQTEIHFSFIIKNFFFVYLGIIFDFEEININLLGVCGIILLIIYVSRYLSVRISALNEPTFKQHIPIMVAMVPRGFMAIFVALMPSINGIEIPQIKEIALITVLLSTVTTILGSIIYERKEVAQKVDPDRDLYNINYPQHPHQ